MDFFSDEGKGIWKWLDEREPEAEHHAPDLEEERSALLDWEEAFRRTPCP